MQRSHRVSHGHSPQVTAGPDGCLQPSTDRLRTWHQPAGPGSHGGGVWVKAWPLPCLHWVLGLSSCLRSFLLVAVGLVVQGAEQQDRTRAEHLAYTSSTGMSGLQQYFRHSFSCRKDLVPSTSRSRVF